MQFRDANPVQRALFALHVLAFAASLVVSGLDKEARIGAPDVGWTVDLVTVSPTRHDASDAGLRGGGIPLAVNGRPAIANPGGYIVLSGVETRVGDTNTLRFEKPSGEIREVTITVRPWTWQDFIFAEGAALLIALLFFAVGTGTFLLRPFETASWALLSLCTVAAALLIVAQIPLEPTTPLSPLILFFFPMLALLPASIVHAGLAFPVLHASLERGRRTLVLLYATAPLLAVVYLGGWANEWQGPWAYSRLIGSSAWMAAVTFFVGRCLQLSILADDRVVRQRARILLTGILAGFAPLTVVFFLQETYGTVPIDHRFLTWPLVFFLIAVARVTLRHEILNARIAVRRAVMYLSAVAILTAIAVLLSTFRDYAVAVLLFPLLYLWPRFDARLNARLYPMRQRFPEIVREIGTEMATASSEAEVLRILAEAPPRLCGLCDDLRSVAFLFAEPGQQAHVAFAAPGGAPPPVITMDEPLLQLMGTLRKEITRAQITLETQFANIREACLAGLDRLGAEMVLPIERDGRVVGGLAVGARASGDVYEQAEVDALSMLVQQASQSLLRIAATERLRSRELEFAELKRFFPPQVIDQVMAQGGAAELRSQRKHVTVVFVDLRGFTSFSDSVEPEEVMATLAEYHAVMGARIAEFAGTLERFAGDGFMVFFNDPVEQPDHVRRAAAMARAMLRDVERLREGWKEKGYRIDVGIGIHTGFATCGFIGYEGRRDYGVIGNVTNLAARLSDAAQPGEILVSARVRTELGEEATAEPVGEVSLKGFHQPQDVYRVLPA
jgi:class 3 adenylate cyclase